MMVIDTHGHLVPRDFPDVPAGVPPEGWPRMLHRDDGTACMMIDGAEFRVFESAYWDTAERLAFLDAEMITLQIISPLPELLGYWLDPATTAALADFTNRSLAQSAAAAPQRLVALGMLPLQDVARSCDMVADAVALGLHGFLVASNVNGRSIADAQFYPVLAAAERHGLALFVHGYRPAGTERFLGSPLLGPITGVPQDTMAAITSFIATDVLGKFPDLRLGFAHGGGSFGAVLDRFDHVWHSFAQLRKTIPMAPREYVRRFFFDSVTFSVPYLRYLLDAFGSDTLMAGTDGPTPIGQRGLPAFIASACNGDAVTVEKVLWKNAARCFGLAGLPAGGLAVTAELQSANVR